ncbi:LysR family transcriptional regulator [Mesorhizobium sp. L-8-3]|nr:LysR family transcriptional regulator [Mesorhizobium sp. L-8-3]
MLNVSAAAVSRMLKHTESQIGFDLFNRTSTGFIPTPEAGSLLGDLEQVHLLLKRIEERLRTSETEDPSIRIGASPGLGLSLVPKVLARIRETDASAEFDLDVLHIDEIVPHLELGTCDFALTIYDMDDPRVECRKLAEAPLICLVPASHPLASRGTITLKELAAHDLVGFDQRSFQQKMIDRLFGEKSLRPRYRSRARLMVTACALVREGLGATLLDAFTVLGAPPEGTRVLELQEEVLFPLNLVSSPKRPLSQRSLAFLRVLHGLVGNETTLSGAWGEPHKS